MTNAELEVFLLQVVRNVAAKVHVQDLELKSRTELLGDIKNAQTALFARLQDLIIAYLNWYYFHSEIELLGSAGNLDQETQQQLQARVSKRDQTRAALVNSLK